MDLTLTSMLFRLAIPILVQHLELCRRLPDTFSCAWAPVLS